MGSWSSSASTAGHLHFVLCFQVEQLDGLQHMHIPSGQQYKSPGEAYVEGDASSASYFLAGTADMWDQFSAVSNGSAVSNFLLSQVMSLTCYNHVQQEKPCLVCTAWRCLACHLSGASGSMASM